jgi:hypothetical protein
MHQERVVKKISENKVERKKKGNTKIKMVGRC